MARFLIHGAKPDGTRKQFFYDNQTSALLFADGTPVPMPELIHELGQSGHVGKDRKYSTQDGTLRPVHQVTRDNPAGKARHALRKVKIQLGLSCNYSCDYCSQRYVPHAEQTGPTDIEPFLAGLPDWLQADDGQIEFEFWGGEPFVYWKTLRPLAEALRERYPLAKMFVITNGSLLDREKIDWLDAMGFIVAVSHDGPGQHIRGPDPLADPDRRTVILELYKRLAPAGRFSFNPVLSRGNTSRADICAYFRELTGDPDVYLGEGNFIDPYDEGGDANSLQSKAEQMSYRQQAFIEGRTGAAHNMTQVSHRMVEFVNAIARRRNAQYIGQKCGMDRPDYLAVDLKGNVITCQNISASAMAPNGEPHKIGHVSDFDAIRLNTVTHWSQRHECPDCPVLQLCKGACMFLQGPLWERGCDNAFSDHIATFAMAIEYLTGFVPIRVEGPNREERHNIWGESKQAKPRKIIPIKFI